MAACDTNNCGPAGLAQAGQDGQPPLQSLLECPVCHEVAQPPIFTCIGSHHMFCSDCRGKVQACPLCKSAICDQRCMFAEQCMEHMRLPCKHYHEGCKAILKGTEYRAHLNNCPFRPIECFISRCGKKIPFFQYFDHIKDAHRNKVNGIDDCNKHIVEWWIEGDPAATARWPPYYFTCYNQVFLYMAISTVHGMWEWVWIIGNDEDAKRFRVIARVENVEKMAELTWKGAVHSIRKSVHEIVSSGLAFVTNSKELRNPYLFRKSGEGSRYFWRTDVEIIEVEPPPPGAMMYLETKENSKKTGAKKTPGLHSTTEAPEIIGNTSGKGFMRQSGPNSLTPSQIMSLEEENKNTGSRTPSNTNVSIRKPPQHRESNMVGKASIIANQQDMMSMKAGGLFDNPNAQFIPRSNNQAMRPEPTEPAPSQQMQAEKFKYPQRQPNEKAFWESNQYQAKVQQQGGFPATADLSQLGSMLKSFDGAKTNGVTSPGMDDKSRASAYQSAFSIPQDKGQAQQLKGSNPREQGSSDGGSVAGNPDSSLSFTTDTTYSGQSLRSDYPTN